MPQRYQIPTRLHTEDTVLTLGGLALIMRQSLILLGSCLALPCWHALQPLSQDWGGAGFVLRLVLTALPLVLALIGTVGARALALLVSAQGGALARNRF